MLEVDFIRGKRFRPSSVSSERSLLSLVYFCDGSVIILFTQISCPDLLLSSVSHRFIFPMNSHYTRINIASFNKSDTLAAELIPPGISRIRVNDKTHSLTAVSTSESRVKVIRCAIKNILLLDPLLSRFSIFTHDNRLVQFARSDFEHPRVVRSPLLLPCPIFNCTD